MADPGTLQKSPEAYRTISEVAADLKLPQHVLRFWETRFSQVKPLKRAGGRRFYRPEDVDLLRAVKALLYGDGYTIKGVQRILREQGPRAVAALAASPSRRGPPPPVRTAAVLGIDEAEPASAMRLDGQPMPVAPRTADADLRSRAETPCDAAERLRVVLADLDDCARLLDTLRAASGRADPPTS